MNPTVSLPPGVAAIRVESSFGTLVASSERLTSEERRAALLLAHQQVKDGARAVLVYESELAAALREVA